MKELIGRHCQVAWSVPYGEQPLHGSSWLRVLGVDMPMIKLASVHDDDRAVWVHVNMIKTIEEV